MKRRVTAEAMPPALASTAVPRLAASTYLNSAPLVWSFARGGAQSERVAFSGDAAPSRCAEMLAAGRVDAALTPVIEYQRQADLLIVPDVCIGARRAVRSVVLATRKTDWRAIQSVALSNESRTSAALVRVLFREFIGHEPRWTESPPQLAAMLAETDAALLIGDPAMTFDRAQLQVFDLAQEWRRHTGHGFVFAMWAVRAAVAANLRGIDFAAARDEGLAHITDITAEYALSLNLPQQELTGYLRHNIEFSLDADLRAGMELYFALAHKHGLLAELQPLRWLAAADVPVINAAYRERVQPLQRTNDKG